MASAYFQQMMAIIAAGAGGVVVPDLPTLAASYSVGLAAASEEGEFYLASPDNLRAYIYRKTGSVADLNRVEPINNRATLWAVRAAVNAAPALPGSPLVNYDAVDALWSVRELRNRALAVHAPLDLLSGVGGLNGDFFYTNGATALTNGLTDSLGGNRAIRYQVASGSDKGASTAFVLISLPPGRWTFAVDLKIGASGSSGDVKLTIGGSQSSAVTPTSSWTTAQFTLTNTSGWAGSGGWEFATAGLVSAESGATTTADLDVVVGNFRLVPGASAGASLTIDRPLILRGSATDSIKVSSDFGFENTTASPAPNSNAYVAGFPSTKAIDGRTYIFAQKGIKASASKVGLLMFGRGSAQDAFGQTQTLSQSQLVSRTLKNNFFGSELGAHMISGYPEVVAYTYSGGSWSLFINGTKVETKSSSDSTCSLTAVSLNCGGTPASPGNPFEGTIYGGAIYDTALSDSDVAAASVSMLARIAARSISTAPKFIYLSEGDSNTAGSGDDVSGYAHRAPCLLTHPVIHANRAVPGAILGSPGDAAESNSLYGRLAGDIAKIQGYQAEGYKVIVSTMIGTNNATGITTQAEAEAYYTSWMSWVQSIRAAGARVIVCSQIPTDQSGTAAYDRTSVTIGASATAGALAGNSYNGLRKYIRALIARDTANWDDYANIASGDLEDFSPTYFVDEAIDVHLNPAGHASAAVPLSEALQRVITAWV